MMIQDPADQIHSSWPAQIASPRTELTCTLSFTLCVVLWCTWAMMVKKRSQDVGAPPPPPPGPRGLPLIGSLLSLEPDLHRYFAKLSKIYGPIMKIQLGSKPCVVMSSPSLAKEVLREHDAIFANRDVTAAAVALTYDGADIVFSPYGPDWRMLRKVFVREMMTSSVLESYYSLRRREVHHMVSQVRAQGGATVDVGELVFGIALNVVTGMIWGDTLDGEGRRRVGGEFRRATDETMALLSKTNVSDLFPGLSWLDLQGVVRRTKRTLAWFDRIFEGVIDRILMRTGRGGEGGERKSKDFLQLLLQIKEERDPKMPLTQTQIKALLLDLVVGGADTTSTTIEWAMSEMMQNPEVMRKVQEELAQVVGMDNLVEESHVPKLSYLDAVLKEVLRLHPPVVFLVPRRPSRQCTVGGYTVPKGAQVMINTWAIHRDPEVWDNPLDFCPERFYNSTSKWDYSGHDFRYLPFGSGRRMCAGVPMADRMLTYMLASLLHSFEWRLPEDTKLDLSDKFGIILKKATRLLAVPTPRLLNPELYS